ncbi:MAG: DNA methylase N-4/N-6 domain-containing protein [Methanosaeta sp. NSP1]|nr:MAG: DNA methylase N-4/N-6 domain-containing protein [Methanosaeta sp. NSP1]
MKTDHKIYIGNSRQMKEVPDQSVSCVVTSPPYVTTLMKKGQKFDYAAYREMIQDVFKEVWRVLIPDGRFCLNVADIRSKYFYNNGNGLYRVPISADLLMLSQGLGFLLFDTFIWDKGFNRNFGGPLLGSYPYPASIYNNVYFEYIFILKKPGKRNKLDPEIKKASEIDKETWKQYVQKFWRIESETEWFKGHEAVFPEEIPRRLIRMYSFAGDTVLDPFAGSGTTIRAAMNLDRNSIGYEINEDLIPVVKRRLDIGQTLLIEREAQIEISFAQYRVRESME